MAGPFLQMPRRGPFFGLRGLVARASLGPRCASPKLVDPVLALGRVGVNDAVDRQPQDSLSRTVLQLLPSDRRAARSRRSPRLRIVIITPARQGWGGREVAGDRPRQPLEHGPPAPSPPRPPLTSR